MRNNNFFLIPSDFFFLRGKGLLKEFWKEKRGTPKSDKKRKNACDRARTDDLRINSPSLWPTELHKHGGAGCFRIITTVWSFRTPVPTIASFDKNTFWRQRCHLRHVQYTYTGLIFFFKKNVFFFCLLRGSNTRPLPYEGSALPLSQGSGFEGDRTWTGDLAITIGTEFRSGNSRSLWPSELHPRFMER